MADNLNTTYLGQPTSADNLNTVSLANSDSAATQHVLSVISYANAQVFNGAVTLGGATTQSGAQTVSGAMTITGATSCSNTFTSTGTIDAQNSVLLSRDTTASATSLTCADGELAIMERTVDNVTLIFRSGVTTYHWVSSAGSVG